MWISGAALAAVLLLGLGLWATLHFSNQRRVQEEITNLWSSTGDDQPAYLQLPADSSRKGRTGSNVFDAITEEVQLVFDRSVPAVVKIRSLSGATPLAGTGFFIDKDGTLLTAYAVVRESDRVWIEFNGQKLEASVLGRDARSGVALLRVDRKNTPYLPFGNSDDLRMASGLISVAYPLNLPIAPSFGFVTGFDVRYLNRFFSTTHIRANIPISPGQIGGPILNSRGQVVGLLAMAIQEGKECYILPVNSVVRIAADMHKNGKVRHGWVGVAVVEGQPLTEGTKPVVVSNLFPETPAATSGIMPGDVVLKIGNRNILTPRDVLDASFFSSVGQKLPVLVLRNNEQKTFTITVAERRSPVSAGLVMEPQDNFIAPFVTPQGRGPQRVHSTQP
ncbi:MAG: S1C family serine protease [Candidatus Methylacidiphilales bacterium]|nr:S1C family serine protease [Candidatus Methylacidiphilales bacterium]